MKVTLKGIGPGPIVRQASERKTFDCATRNQQNWRIFKQSDSYHLSGTTVAE